MPQPTSRQQASSAWQLLIDRARMVFCPPRAPDHVPSPRLTPHEEWLLRLERIRDLLEQTRASLIRDGWTSGGWFSVASGGAVRQVSTAEAIRLARPGNPVSGACLVGAMLRLVDDPDTAPSVTDAWGCVDELFEAIHERMGHQSFPAGRIYSHDQRRAHLRALTEWNDAPGRHLDEVLDLIDRAVSRTLLAACAQPAR